MADEYGAQLSVKFGPNGNSMINVRADDVTALAEEVNRMAELGSVIVASAEDFVANATVVAAFPNTTTVQDARPSQPAQANNSAAPVCAHGVPMKYREGVAAKTGKAYKLWGCTVKDDPRMPECQAKFLN